MVFEAAGRPLRQPTTCEAKPAKIGRGRFARALHGEAWREIDWILRQIVKRAPDARLAREMLMVTVRAARPLVRKGFLTFTARSILFRVRGGFRSEETIQIFKDALDLPILGREGGRGSAFEACESVKAPSRRNTRVSFTWQRAQYSNAGRLGILRSGRGFTWWPKRDAALGWGRAPPRIPRWVVPSKGDCSQCTGAFLRFEN